MIFIEYYYADFFDKSLTFIADHSIVTTQYQIKIRIAKKYLFAYPQNSRIPDENRLDTF